MQKTFLAEERLAILRMADSERKWYSLDDKRICAICDRSLAAVRSISAAWDAGSISCGVLHRIALRISVIGFSTSLHRPPMRMALRWLARVDIFTPDFPQTNKYAPTCRKGDGVINQEEERLRLTIPLADAISFALGRTDLGYVKPEACLRWIMGILASKFSMK